MIIVGREREKDIISRNQLKAFNESLSYYSDENGTVPKDWFEAFRRSSCDEPQLFQK